MAFVITEESASAAAFGTGDWVTLSLYLIACVAAGWYASRSKPQDTSSDFFLAGKSAGTFTVAVSLVSGLTSGISFLGTPSFTYAHGYGFGFASISVVLTAPFVVFVLAPFYHRIGSSSIYAYLEERFSKNVRTAVACLFIVRMAFYMGIVLYAPAIAIKGITGMPEWITVLVCGISTTLYTCKGGMSSVILTDFMQSLVLTVGAIVCMSICIAGTPPGSFADAWRLDGFFKFDPFRETTFWSIVVGNWFQGVAQGGTNQIAVQRYMSTPSLKTMQKTAFAGWMLNAAFTVVLTMLGISLFAYYSAHGGLPHLDSPDKILPYFISHALPEGVRGLLIAAILGCTMSVVSGCLNAISTVLFIDILENVFAFDGSNDTRVVAAAKIITLVSGGVAIFVALLCQLLGDSLIKLNQTFLGMTSGPVLGTFLLGMLTVRANAKGVLLSFALSTLLILYFGIGSLWCTGNSTSTAICSHGFLTFAEISNFWFNPFLCVFTFLVGCMASAAFEGRRFDVEKLTMCATSGKEHEEKLLVYST